MYLLYLFGFLFFSIAFLMALAFPPGITNGVTALGILYLLVSSVLAVFCFYKLFEHKLSKTKRVNKASSHKKKPAKKKN